MNDSVNRQFLLASRPGDEIRETDFRYHEGEVPEPGDGQMLVQVTMVAVEPALRGVMAENPDDPGNLQIGDTMRAIAAGRVLKSRHPDFAAGDPVQGLFGFADYVVTHPGALLFSRIPDGVPMEAALYVFNTSGLTAYLGMEDIAAPGSGDGVLVSAAAGAVGSLAVQIARNRGARVVGIAGSDEKCRWLVDDLGIDGAINYKREKLEERIDALLPGGIDVYFDNVGGVCLDTAIGRLREGSRLILCGRISEYAQPEASNPVENAARLLTHCQRMERLVLFDHADRFSTWSETMAGWLAEGSLTYRVDMLEGFERLPEALIRLFTGANIGKQLVRI